MRDTTAEAERIRLAAIRAMKPGERLRQALELSESARHLALSALRHRHPGRSDLELVELSLGRRLVEPEAQSSRP
jgi:hypothetical protein